jgi:hypothetical protein
MSEEYIIIKIDRHAAIKTGAYTRWYLHEKASMVKSTQDGSKTHWWEYWLVPRDSHPIRMRRSNRGNTDLSQFKAEELKVSDEEIEALRLEGCQF